jgi:hypothetical protein
MQQNSELLSAHLKRLLHLQNKILDDDAPNDREDDSLDSIYDEDRLVLDHKILQHVAQLEIPIFLSIDASLDKGEAVSSISIVVPDTRENDTGLEWHDRPAKSLFTRAWRVPKYWGTTEVCISMAETFGFIIGEYSIPTDMPIIHITDSNNARTLQRNIKQGEQYTHRYMIRHIKQGIDHAIANHLEYLTSLWPQEENLDPYILELYKKGEDICRVWASKQMSGNTIPLRLIIKQS